MKIGTLASIPIACGLLLAASTGAAPAQAPPPTSAALEGVTVIAPRITHRSPTVPTPRCRLRCSMPSASMSTSNWH